MENYKPYPKVPDHAGDEYPLTDRCIEILRAALSGRAYGPGDFVFIGSNGNPYSESYVREIFMKAATKTGYTVPLNVFGRHSMGYQLREAGASYDDIADVLGNTPQMARANYAYMEAVKKGKILQLRRGFVPGMSLAQKSEK